MRNRHPLSFTHLYPDPSITNKEGKTAHFTFPSIYDAASVTLSVIVPAYNEALRLPKMLNETLQILTDRAVAAAANDSNFTFEIIIVDDGSSDATCDVVLETIATAGSDRVRLLRLPYNMGKGGAVQQGVLHSRGKHILFADADGASDFTCLPRLEAALARVESNGLGAAIGSRAHLQEDAVAERKWYRTLLMRGFHFLVHSLSGVRHVKDTQCGFKLFTRKTALVLFTNQRLTRWCFDVELLYSAAALAIPVEEVAINWEEVDGSKVNLMDASFTMARDLAVIRLAYTSGVWDICPPDSPTLLNRLPRGAVTAVGGGVPKDLVAHVRKLYPLSAAVAAPSGGKAKSA